MSKLNCWEYKQCGREPGGKHTEDLGVCPVPQTKPADGLNCGNNAGRACWAISKSLCGDRVQGNYTDKIGACMDCAFYKNVLHEELIEFKTGKEILEHLQT